MATLGQQVGFERELDARAVELARRTAAADDPVLRDRLTRAYIGLSVLRAHTLRTLASAGAMPAGRLGGEAALGALAPRARRARDGRARRGGHGRSGQPPYDLDDWQRLFLFSRADTIYGGSDEIQRTIIAERVLGLPRQAAP